MIVIVAPYSPIGRSQNPNLGAARKIDAVIGMLGSLSSKVILINSAHNEETNTPWKTRDLKINDVHVTEISPPTYKNRKIGKLINLIHVRKAVNECLKMGQPRLVWIYNGYSFESLFGLFSLKAINCPIILEFEDWHFSRDRGINPKPIIDWALWKLLTPHILHTFSVNSQLAEKVTRKTECTTLFPGVVSQKAIALGDTSIPFNTDSSPQINVGYFGGLSVEKGANLILDLASDHDQQIKIIVTGSGPLSSSFSHASDANPGKIEYHGNVTEDKLYELMQRCDIIVNPHSPITSMGNGVFPFKVIEAVASGRLVISTQLPDTGLKDVLQGVLFIDHTLDSLKSALIDSKSFYTKNLKSIRNGRALAINNFSHESITMKIKKVISFER